MPFLDMSSGTSLSALILTLATATCLSAQVPGSVPPVPLDNLAPQHPPAALVHSTTFQETDLLRRGSFRTAQQATVTVQVFNKAGQNLSGLKIEDFSLMVNGTQRTGVLRGPSETLSAPTPLVLMVFPPNQPIVHSIAIKQAKAYFSAQPNELLPWRVAILDSDGTSTSFSNGKTQLLAYLDELDHKKEPFQYASYIGGRRGFNWGGSWLTKAEQKIAQMQVDDGPKVILAFNTIADGMYGGNDIGAGFGGAIEDDGPEVLTPVAMAIGAHIYIANVGGPDVLVPGGDASNSGLATLSPNVAELIGPGFRNPYTLGSPNTPSYVLTSGRQIATLNYFAYRGSLSRQTAADTFGGLSNSLTTLTGQIHHDLDNNYAITFELTAADRDKGTPEVEVRMVDRKRKVNIENLVPAGADMERKLASRQRMNALWAASNQPVSSPDFQVSQHVDYFPLRNGLQPVLPMIYAVEWKGSGAAPEKLSIAEFVVNTGLSSAVMQREVDANWIGKGWSWERDGHLTPGEYAWRVVLHDDANHILVSSEKKFKVDFPQGALLTYSSLILGKSCRNAPTDTLRHYTDVKSTPEQTHSPSDPMRANDCRVKPEATGIFTPTDVLHTFLRIYPAGKIEKQPPEKWAASFTLRSAAGAIELQRDLTFSTDSGSGYLASVELPLNSPEVHDGPHTLDVHVRGPGIRKELVESRPLTIAPTAH